MTDVSWFPHQVTRLVFDTGQPYDQFRARYEAAVPALDEKRLAGFAARGAAWPEVVADADASADRWYRNSRRPRQPGKTSNGPITRR